jgi:DNA end-binding protein Ku
MARAIWKGVIRFEGVAVPVKLYAAVQDRSIHFRLLHQGRTPVKQQMVDPLTDEPVPAGQIRRGYEVEPGVFVVLDEDDLATLEPDASRDIEITRFVDPALINHQWYDRPYYLGHDGDAGSYAAFAAALAATGKEGLARWVMRKKEYIGALRSEGDHLLLITLRHANEVIPASALEPPQGRKLDAREIRMAEQLVSALEGNFDPLQFRDEYRDRVLELIEAKSKGRKVATRSYKPRKVKDDSLAAVLEKSVAAARKGKAA